MLGAVRTYATFDLESVLFDPEESPDFSQCSEAQATLLTALE